MIALTSTQASQFRNLVQVAAKEAQVPSADVLGALRSPNPVEAAQYLATLALMARYWASQDWLMIEWMLAVLRGQLPIGKLQPEPCDRCGKHFASLHQMHEVRLCNGCIQEFIDSKTKTVSVI